MNPLAKELNEILKKESPTIFNMLSKLGKELFYPKGILTQAAEASKKKAKLNATIGIATEENTPMYLSCIYDNINNLSPSEALIYSPSFGNANLRQAWQDKIYKENPSLKNKEISLPVVTNALTHGLSIVADMFIEEGDTIVVPDMYWGNLNMIFSVRRGAKIATYKTFLDDGSYNVEGLLHTIKEVAKNSNNKVVVILNFPNNPSGYTPSFEEAQNIANGLTEVANSGIKIVATTDDAYFGLNYEDSFPESIFSLLVSRSDNLLAIKVDGATKEEFAWGLRVGFITFGILNNNFNQDVFVALEKKVAGLIRGTISNGSTLSQNLVLRALNHPEFASQRNEKYDILKNRYLEVKRILSNNKYQDNFSFYPFNSGYFMCLKLKNVNAKELRTHLLDKYSLGTIATNDTDLRIAYSCIEKDILEELFDTINQGCIDLT